MKMKLAIYFSSFLIIFLIPNTEAIRGYYDLNKSHVLFEKFIQDFKKVYKDEADKQLHYKAFKESLKLINKMYLAGHPGDFEINRFADYTDEESRKFVKCLSDQSCITTGGRFFF